MTIRSCDLPAESFLRRYDRDGGYTDCFVVEALGQIPLKQYIEAFYTTGLFKAERAVLSLAGRPSSDIQASQIAQGTTSTFAAWSVEDRAEDQLLMCTGRTRSWLMVKPILDGVTDKTLLYFGSAVTPVKNKTTGRSTIGPVFKAFERFHILYSRALLAAAKKRTHQFSNKVKP